MRSVRDTQCEFPMPELRRQEEAVGEVVVRRPALNLITFGLRDVPQTPGVYFLLSHDEAMVKIGKASNPRKRIRDIRHMNPHPLHVLGVVFGYTNVETRLHELWRRKRSHGEWFQYDEELAKYIERLTSGRWTIDELMPQAVRRDRYDLSNTTLVTD